MPRKQTTIVLSVSVSLSLSVSRTQRIEIGFHRCTIASQCVCTFENTKIYVPGQLMLQQTYIYIYLLYLVLCHVFPIALHNKYATGMMWCARATADNNKFGYLWFKLIALNSKNAKSTVDIVVDRTERYKHIIVVSSSLLLCDCAYAWMFFVVLEQKNCFYCISYYHKNRILCVEKKS